MMKALRCVLTLAVVLAIAVPVMAAGKGKRGEKKEGGERGQAFGQLVKELNLTPEQQTKVEAVVEELKGKFQEARDEMEGVYTEEQKQARREAQKKAKEEGKTGKEALQAVESAVTLTPEQQEKMAKARKDMAAVMKEFAEKVTPILTPEQQETLKASMKRAGGEGKGRGGKKKKQEQ